ncbi:MAG TPA: OmpA family protein [Stellaceae bacterium]|nr:OmpA family protein [Stellaceae bacterium]
MRSALAGASRGVSPHGAEGGDYFASMTDLMLGLVFVFVIMLMAFALNFREAEQHMSDATRQLTEADLARRDLLRELAHTLQSVLPVTVDEDNGTLQLGGDILFPKSAADPYPEALPKLRLLGYALDRVLPCYAGGLPAEPEDCAKRRKGRLDAVYIEGHTDDVPIRTPRFQNNWELSAARASQTYATLVGAYPALSQLRNDKGERLIGVSGYGEYRPVAPGTSEEARQKNRRIELRFIMVSPKNPEAGGVMGAVERQRSGGHAP